jgi:hypothetical protein
MLKEEGDLNEVASAWRTTCHSIASTICSRIMNDKGAHTPLEYIKMKESSSKPSVIEQGIYYTM